MKWNRGTDFADDEIGSGRDGFTDGDPDAEPVVPASEVGEEWLNAVSSELCRAIEILGGTLSYVDNEQLGDLVYGLIRGDLALPSPSSETRRIAPVGLGNGWIPNINTGEVIATVDSAPYVIDLGAHLPNGATLTAIQVRILPGGARSAPDRMSVQVYPYTGDQTQGTAIKAATGDSGAATYQNVGATGLSVTIAKATTRYLVHVTAGNSGGGSPNDRIAYVEVTFTDNYPGRR